MREGSAAAFLRLERGPLRAVRTCKAKYPPFDGTGAALEGGRWNSPGAPVIYAAASYAGALLEILVHAGTDELPGAHHAVTIDVPAGVAIERLVPEEVPGWDAPNERAARRAGDAWRTAGRSAVLLVPSVVAAPLDWNVVIDPLHADAARLVVSVPTPVHWDPRLFTRASVVRDRVVPR